MKITIQNRGASMSTIERDEVRELVQKGLKYFDDRIQRVSLWFLDENGPRGGVDQVCRIQVWMAPRMIAFGEARELSRGVAVSVALDRVQGQVKEMVERRRDHGPRRVVEFDDTGRALA
jgi:hypothetical protein